IEIAVLLKRIVHGMGIRGIDRRPASYLAGPVRISAVGPPELEDGLHLSAVIVRAGRRIEWRVRGLAVEPEAIRDARLAPCTPGRAVKNGLQMEDCRAGAAAVLIIAEHVRLGAIDRMEALGRLS